MTKRRAEIPRALKYKLLVEANHSCTICGRSGVQIHHIDGNPANNAEDNLIVLCPAHHDEAEKSKSSKGISANLTPEVLREYKRRLKAGHRLPPVTDALAQSVSATLTDVMGSQAIITTSDVIVNPP